MTPLQIDGQVFVYCHRTPTAFCRDLCQVFSLTTCWSLPHPTALAFALRSLVHSWTISAQIQITQAAYNDPAGVPKPESSSSPGVCFQSLCCVLTLPSGSTNPYAPLCRWCSSITETRCQPQWASGVYMETGFSPVSSAHLSRAAAPPG